MPSKNDLVSSLLFISGFALGMVLSPYLRFRPEFFQFVQTSFNCSQTPEPVSLAHNTSDTPISPIPMHDILSESPVRPMHNMSEEELLWRASFAPKIPHLPSSRVPKIAFLFLTKGDLPLAPFWDEFFKGHDGLYSIYVHPNPAYKGSVANNSAFYGRRIPSKPVSWASINMIEAERRLVANALLDSSNERFVLLSEACIPLYNFTTIYSYLVNSNMSYVGSFQDPGLGCLGRYNPAMAPQITAEQWYKAPQWFEMNRALAVELVSDEMYFQLFKRFCINHGVKRCIPDEHYIPTFIAGISWSNYDNRTLTYAKWSPGTAHPASFGKDDVTIELIDKIRNIENCTYNGIRTRVCSLFARKFLPNSLDLLMKLGPELKIFGQTKIYN